VGGLCLFSSCARGEASPIQKQIEAGGSVAIGGDVTGATITRQQRGLPETEAIAMRGIVPALGVLFALAVACPDAHAEERPPVHAGQGSIAIGGSVSNSTIGVPYEKLEEAVRSRTKDLEDLTASEKEIVVLLKEKLVF
jgi:hypothetical protein